MFEKYVNKITVLFFQSHTRKFFFHIFLNRFYEAALIILKTNQKNISFQICTIFIIVFKNLKSTNLQGILLLLQSSNTSENAINEKMYLSFKMSRSDLFAFFSVLMQRFMDKRFKKCTSIYHDVTATHDVPLFFCIRLSHDDSLTIFYPLIITQ